MTLVALCAAKGAPGVTTLACAIGAAWPAGRSVVVAECDPSGGDLAARFGLSPRQGMTSLVLARRNEESSAQGLSAHVQHLPGGLEVLAGPVSAEAASALDAELGRGIDGLFPDVGDVLVDCGRLIPGAVGQESVLRAARVVLFLLRPDVAGLAHAFSAFRHAVTVAPGVRALLVIVGHGPFAVAEVEETLGADVLHVVPVDVSAAAVACGEPGNARRFGRSRLVAAARKMADALQPEPNVGENGAPAPCLSAERFPRTRSAASA